LGKGSKKTVCPWCQTEIVWDEETGPESVCPYCENELGAYRTIHIGLEPEDESAQEVVEGSECSYCGETTVLAGHQTVTAETFVPVGALKPPFTLDVYLCPSCMQVQYVLSELNRRRLEKEDRSDNL
jgi:hypothetical protein